VLFDTCANSESLLHFPLHDPTDTFNFLAKISRLFFVPAFSTFNRLIVDCFVVAGAMTMVMLIRLPLPSATVDLKFNILRCQAEFSPSTLDPLAAFANACPQSP
jgi:hypothetical protein